MKYERGHISPDIIDTRFRFSPAVVAPPSLIPAGQHLTTPDPRDADPIPPMYSNDELARLILDRAAKQPEKGAMRLSAGSATPRTPANVRDSIYRIVADPKLTATQKALSLKAIAAANDQAKQMTAAYVMGPMGGVADMHLRPELAPKVPAGVARPFAPGEYVDNPDGSWSSERSMTVQNPDGSWGVIPSVWIKNGRPYEAANEDEAMRLAAATKLPFKKFKSLNEADQFSIDRENAWQPLQRPEDADKIAPLWDMSPAPQIATPTSENIGNAIDKQSALAIAALSQPTTYPVPR